MRILVMFDLPMGTAEERKIYTQFRKYLIRSGFMMLQESVYCKLALNSSTGNYIIAALRKHCPQDGSVLVLKITEKQYNDMEYLAGEKKRDVLDSTERIVIL